MILCDVVGCNVITEAANVFALNTTFSQAPGTRLLYMCTSLVNLNPQVIVTTCQKNGLWKPSLEDIHCLFNSKNFLS